MSAHHPTTSAPSIGEFVEIYERLADGADGIVSVHISSKLSATYNVAEQAAQQANVSCPIQVIDSSQASQGLGMTAIATAKAANDGGDMDTVVATAKSAMGRSQCIALFDTLEFLQRGGRIGKARAFLGSLLRIKPMIVVREGEVQPLGRARTYAKGVDFLRKTAHEFGTAEELCVIYSTEKSIADELAGSLAELLPDGKTPFVARFGPAVGTHVGPRAVGVGMLQAKE